MNQAHVELNEKLQFNIFQNGKLKSHETQKKLFHETLMEADLKIKRGKKFQTRDLKVPF